MAPKDHVVEVEFQIRDLDYPVVWLSAEEDCEIRLEQLVTKDESGFRGYFSVTGTDPEVIDKEGRNFDHLTIEPLTIDGDRGLFAFEMNGPLEAEFSPLWDLVDAKAVIKEARADRGECTYIVELPNQERATTFIEEFQRSHPAAELIRKRTRRHEMPIFGVDDFQSVIEDVLTERQREILIAAFDAGYYENPRGMSSQELADRFDISQQALSETLRVAERKVMSLVYGEREGSVS